MKPISSRARHGLLLTATSSNTAYSILDCLVSLSQLCIVLFVVALIGAIMSVGYFGLLPNLISSPRTLFWSRALAAFFFVNILVNYCIAALRGSKSNSTRLPVVEGKTIPRGFYDNYRCIIYKRRLVVGSA